MLINNYLENSAQYYPEKTALIYRKRSYTYLEIDRHANKLANGLVAEGLKRQDRVGILLDSSYEMVISIFGVLKAGGTFFIINPETKSKKCEYTLNNCTATTLVTDKKNFKKTTGFIYKCPSLKTIIITDCEVHDEIAFNIKGIHVITLSDILNKYQNRRPIQKHLDTDLACLIYTSGSTGAPKGVMCPHKNMSFACSSIIEYIENIPDDIILNVLPMSFDYGLYQLLMVFKFSGTIVIERNFIFPHMVLDLLVREKVTGFPIVPTIAAVLLKIRNLNKYDFSKLRYITNTAAVLPSQHIFKLKNLFEKTKIFSMYGLTECKRVSYLPPEFISAKPDSVGISIPNTETYIVNEHGEKINDIETVGELIVKGQNIMLGYWKNPEDTDKVFKPGRCPDERTLHTGDLFKIDADGFLYFVGRKDDIIKVSGEKVSPKEIENVLHDLDEVHEAVVFGVDDEITGQAPEAFISFKKGHRLTPDVIIKHCAKHLESFSVPKSIKITTELPKSLNCKIAKKHLPDIDSA